MERRRARPRRLVSPRTIRILRLLGWRRSLARQAWVHRLGNGRYGPVFRVAEEFEPLPKARAITQASRALASEPLKRIPARAEDGLDDVIDFPRPITGPSYRGPSSPPSSPAQGLPKRQPRDPGRGPRRESA